MTEHVRTQLRDGILRLEFNRPDKKNAFTNQMYTTLAEAVERANGDTSVRVVFFQGQPDAFTAGNDLLDFRDNPPNDTSAPVFRFLRALSRLEKPAVAAVGGVAVGIGTTLLLHCDLVYAAANTRFQLPFSKLGLCPEAASSLLLTRLAGHPRAAELLLLGEPFDANKAREIGLINAVFPDADVIDEALAQAAKLVALPASSLRLTKKLMKASHAALVEQVMNDEADHFRRRLHSPEAKEAFAAFFEKRKPDFSRFE